MDNFGLNVPARLRFRKPNTYTFVFPLAFDHISVSLAAAEIRYSNVFILPGYPSENTPVNISADITSAFDLTPAINITPEYYYRVAGAGGFNGPFPMNRFGDTYISSVPIPVTPYPDRVEYYIRTTFNGYHVSPSANQSPMFFPAGGASAPAYYDVRLNASTHQIIQLNGNTSTNGMELIDDNLWQVTFDPTTNSFSFTVEGIGQYTGTNVLDTTNVWGDNVQWNFSPPLQGFGRLGESNITVQINTNFSGQYIFRFNELTGEYAIFHNYYQNFDEWLMSADFFTTGSKSRDNTTWFQNYDDWPVTDTTGIQSVTFDEPGWTNATYTNGAPLDAFTNVSWEVRRCITVGTVNQRQQMQPESGQGHIHPLSSGLEPGTGKLEFKYRAVGTDHPILWKLGRKWADFSMEFDYGAYEVGGDYLNGLPAEMSVYFRRADPTNYYEYRMEPLNATQMNMYLYRMKDGTETLLTNTVQNAELDDFVGYRVSAATSGTNITLTIRRGAGLGLVFSYVDNTTDGITTNGLIGWGGVEVAPRLDNLVVTSSEPNPGGNLSDSFNSTNPNLGSGWDHSGGTWYRRAITNGAPSSEYFCYRKAFADTPPHLTVLQTDIGKMNQPSFYDAHTNLIVTNIAYKMYSTNIFEAETSYMFLERPLTGGAKELRIDDMSQTGWRSESIRSSNGWFVSQGSLLDNANQLTSTPVFVELRPSKAIVTNDMFVRSTLASGVGAVGWRYRSLNGNGAVALEYSTGAASNNWNTLTNYYGISDAWLPRSFQANLAGNHYIRIRNISTNGETILLDEFRINDFQSSDTNTWDGYNIRISGLQTNSVFKGVGSSGYLNHDTSLDTAGGPYADLPHVRSPRLFRGLGEVGFWARNINAASATNAIVAVQSSPNPTGPWTTVDTHYVGRPDYEYFRSSLYDRDARYVRVAVDFTNLTDRAAVDEISIIEPFASDLTVTNIGTFPQIPLFNDQVFLECTLTRLQLAPSNISITAYWKNGNTPWGVGNWSNENATAMVLVSSNTVTPPFTYTYRTTAPIPAHPIDTYIQYYFSVYFEGLFSNITSPKIQDRFGLPTWYEPADFNKELVDSEWQYKEYTTPYYVVFSCPPGSVWMNEMNYVGTIIEQSVGTPEFVELIGPAGTHVRNWKVKFLSNPADETFIAAQYTLTNVVCLPNDTNGHGFVVLGDAAVGPDILLTNGVVGSGAAQDSLPTPRGMIVIERSMGAHEYRYSYGAGGTAFSNATFIGEDAAFGITDETLALSGTGTSYSDFAWMVVSNTGTPGVENSLQTLIELTNLTDACTLAPNVEIVDFWIDTNVWIVCTGTNGWFPAPWYTTNLLTTPWQEVQTYNSSVSGNQHTIWFEPTSSNAPTYYKIITTGP